MPYTTMTVFHYTICVLIIVLYLFISRSIDTPNTNYHCPLDSLKHWSENCYWSSSYIEAREKFLALGKAITAQSKSDCQASNIIRVQQASYNITNESNTMDVILLTLRSSDMRNTEDMPHIIHSSGVHGVEGYLGSAIQIRFLHELYLQDGSCSSSGNERKVLLIHAVNPVGMRHHRRTNENNVDLNRNVLTPTMWEVVQNRQPNFVGYDDLDPVLNPIALTTRGTEWLEEIRDVTQVFWNVLGSAVRFGATNVKRTMVASQYHKQSGVFYGGNGRPEQSILALQHAIYSFANFFNATTDKAVWIDVHTGLGKFAEYSLLVKGDTSQRPLWAKEILSILANSQMGYGVSRDADVSEGYDQTKGFVYGELLCPLSKCLALPQEFGTHPTFAVATALILENSNRERYNHLTNAAFNPLSLSWRHKSIVGGMEVLKKVLE